jgi:polyhydroxybutyrate depolymerase
MKRLMIWGFALACLGFAAMSQAADSQDVTHTLEFGGLKRSYLLHIPAGAPVGPLPLVVGLHGGAGSGASFAKMSGFDTVADLAGFIVVYPNGTDKPRPLREAMGKSGFDTWNAGSCCGYAQEHGVDDVGFIRAVVAEVEKQHAVDPKRIYATGISNGGMMAYRLACEAADLFAAVGPVSAVQEVKSCKPSRPVSVVHIHGADDENVPLKGGVGKKAVEKEDRAPVQDTIDFWVKEDGCSVTANSKQPDVLMQNYGGCEGGTDVDYYIIQDGGHSWPGGDRISVILDKPSQALNASQVIWDFFKDHLKP